MMTSKCFFLILKTQQKVKKWKDSVSCIHFEDRSFWNVDYFTFLQTGLPFFFFRKRHFVENKKSKQFWPKVFFSVIWHFIEQKEQLSLLNSSMILNHTTLLHWNEFYEKRQNIAQQTKSDYLRGEAKEKEGATPFPTSQNTFIALKISTDHYLMCYLDLTVVSQLT